MILLEPDKMRARIHMGVPVLGVQDSGFALGYRFPNVMGLFEDRMNKLQPHEYARIVGVPTAALALYGTPQVGDTLTATIAPNAPVVYTVQASDLLAPDPNLVIVGNFAKLWNQTLGFAFIAQAQPPLTYPTSTVGWGPQTWQLAFVGTAETAFTFTASTTGGMVTYPILQGALPWPKVTFVEDALTVHGYLNILDYLESKAATSSDLMKFSKADVVDFRRDELGAREKLYHVWRKKLAAVFGIPLSPLPPVSNFGGSPTGLAV